MQKIGQKPGIMVHNEFAQLHSAFGLAQIIFLNDFRTYLMKIRYRRIRTECIEIIMEKSMVGDWFLMYLLGQNIDQVIFKDVMQELAKRLGYRSKDSIE